MKLVYPPDNHETAEESTFLLGCIAPGNQLFINGQRVPVSKEGYFSRVMPLTPGENPIVLEEWNQNDPIEKQEILLNRRSGGVLNDLESGQELIQAYAFPVQDVGIRPEESLFLWCVAPPESEVTCQIESITHRELEMTPIPDFKPDNREGCFAKLHQLETPWPEGWVYTAHVRVPEDTPPLPNLWVRYRIKHGEQETTFEANGTVTVLPFGKKQYAKVSVPKAIVRTSPEKGARLTPLLKDTLLEITGFDGEAFRVDYGPHQVAWVDKSQIQMTEHLFFPLLVPVHLIQVQSGLRTIQVSIPLQRIVPFQLQLNSERIVLDIHQSISRCDFTHYEPGVFQKGLSQIQAHPLNSSTTRVVMDFTSRLMGVQPVYDYDQNRLVFNIRTHASLQHTPFVVALDPGHGGEETGAHALDGTPEKTLNLALSLKIKEHLLANSDIQVVLTREQDEPLSLEDRVQRALEAEANMLISIHHNALPDGRNPMEERGVSSYYYHPFALPFVRKIHEGLVAQTDFSDYGILYDSLHLCRVMEMPSMLLELGFLTHPEDVRLCLDPGHQDRVAVTISQVLQSLSPYVKRSA